MTPFEIAIVFLLASIVAIMLAVTIIAIRNYRQINRIHEAILHAQDEIHRGAWNPRRAT